MSRIINTYTEYVEPDNLFTEEEQEQECCEVLSPPPDSCADVGRTSDWNGVDQVSEDSDNGSLQFDPEAIRVAHTGLPGFREMKLIPVGGKDGKCGQKHEEWTDALGCCVNAPQPYWAQVATDLDWNSTYIFKVEGGTPPYTWDADGNGLSVIGAGTSGKVTVTDCFCKPGAITVTDACAKQVSQGVVSEEGYWDPLYADSVWHTVHPFGLGSGGVTGGNVGGYYAGVFVTAQNGEYKTQMVWARLNGYTIGGPTSQAEAIASVCAECDGSYNCVEPLAWPDDKLADGWVKCPDSNVIYRSPGWPPYDTLWVEVMIPGINGTLAGLPHGGRSYEWKCNDAETLVYNDESSPDTIGPNTSAYVWFQGGRGPYSIQVSGDGFWLDREFTSKSTLKAAAGAVKIYTDNDVCGVCNITITDGCTNSVTGSINCTTGRWQDMGDNYDCKASGEFEFMYTGANNWHYFKEADGIKQYESYHQGSFAASATFSRISCDVCATDPQTRDYWATYDPFNSLEPCMTSSDSYFPDWYPCDEWIGAPGGDRFACSPLAGRHWEEWVC